MSVFRSVFGNGWMNECWKCEGHARPRISQALIPNMMYLLRVYAKTQFKSKSLKPRESIINKNSKEWYVISWL